MNQYGHWQWRLKRMRGKCVGIEFADASARPPPRCPHSFMDGGARGPNIPKLPPASHRDPEYRLRRLPPPGTHRLRLWLKPSSGATPSLGEICENRQDFALRRAEYVRMT